MTLVTSKYSYYRYNTRPDYYVRRRKNMKIKDIIKVTYITSFMKGQEIQQFGPTQWEDTNEVRVSIQWSPTNKKPKGKV